MGTPICALTVALLDLSVHVQVYSSPVSPSNSITLPIPNGNAPLDEETVVVLSGEAVVRFVFVVELFCLPPSLTALASAEMRKGIPMRIGGVFWPAECRVFWGSMEMSLYVWQDVEQEAMTRGRFFHPFLRQGSADA
ncbi:hypothetical protein DFS33DRAFT_227176 [Desarmillaria ectypa]|nr:hypothetical protein DFS33DRAFT_227176 [Desarmillaria ectypa]